MGHAIVMQDGRDLTAASNRVPMIATTVGHVLELCANADQDGVEMVSG